MSSIKQVAEKIAERHINSGSHLERALEIDRLRRKACADDIEQALRAERERAAKIVNNARSEGADLRELVARIRDDSYEVEP